MIEYNLDEATKILNDMIVSYQESIAKTSLNLKYIKDQINITQESIKFIFF